jgi:hypothetical protein
VLSGAAQLIGRCSNQVVLYPPALRLTPSDFRGSRLAQRLEGARTSLTIWLKDPAGQTLAEASNKKYKVVVTRDRRIIYIRNDSVSSPRAVAFGWIPLKSIGTCQGTSTINCPKRKEHYLRPTSSYAIRIKSSKKSGCRRGFQMSTTAASIMACLRDQLELRYSMASDRSAARIIFDCSFAKEKRN